MPVMMGLLQDSTNIFSLPLAWWPLIGSPLIFCLALILLAPKLRNLG
jgi:hypothetical protein